MKAMLMNDRGAAFLPLVILLALVGICVWFAGTNTVVRTDKSLFWIEKPHFGLEKIYVDTRDWDVMDYLSNPEITRELAKRGIEHKTDASQHRTGSDATHSRKSQENIKRRIVSEYEQAVQKAKEFTQDMTDRIGNE